MSTINEQSKLFAPKEARNSVSDEVASDENDEDVVDLVHKVSAPFNTRSASNEANPGTEKIPELGLPRRSMVRTRMPDAPGGVGISIRPMPREACTPRVPLDTDTIWDTVVQGPLTEPNETDEA